MSSKKPARILFENHVRNLNFSPSPMAIIRISLALRAHFSITDIIYLLIQEYLMAFYQKREKRKREKVSEGEQVHMSGRAIEIEEVFAHNVLALCRPNNN
jgi:hypothetical protein